MVHRSGLIGWSRVAAVLSGVAGVLLIAGCGLDTQPDYLVPTTDSNQPYVYESELKEESIFGEGGFDLFDILGSGGRGRGGGGGGVGLGVNSYLWRATLDTIAFMPLTSADPFGGVIITDWYTPPETPRERFKMSVYILGRELRADGVKVAVFHQRSAGTGAWVDSAIGSGTATNLENQILARARQLRIASAQN